MSLLALTALLGGCGAEEEAPEATPEAPPPEAAPQNVLLYPFDPVFAGEAPDTFRARFVTNKGEFVVEVVKEWAPLGATRFYNLVRNGFYDDVRFYRAIAGFMVQFGMHGDPAVTAAWAAYTMSDEAVKQSNVRGYVSYAMGGPNTRTTQLFINLADNSRLDESGFSPFGRVVEGMDVVDQLYTGYGEGAPNGQGPSQSQIRSEGNAYLQRDFPQLDYIERATIAG